MGRTLEHGELLVVLLCDGDELIGFLGGGGEGLLADDYDAHWVSWVHAFRDFQTRTVLASL